MERLAIILLMSLVVIIVFELISHLMLGKKIKEKDLDLFFKKHLREYKVNESAYPNRLFYGSDLPFISLSHITFSAKYYIDDYGLIPRQSKWTKKLDKHWEALPKPKSKLLKDL